MDLTDLDKCEIVALDGSNTSPLIKLNLPNSTEIR